jgi:4-hydroxybenzoate polyprenyltransferase
MPEMRVGDSRSRAVIVNMNQINSIKQTGKFFHKVLVYGRMIKFSHTVFAMPFALSAVVLALRNHPLHVGSIIWILVAMIGARSSAMGFNRVADARLDQKNPRTAHREIPSGKLSLASAKFFVALSSAVFILSAAMLGKLCLMLSVPVLLILFGYSYTKRFTRWCHLYLGFAISLAPMGAWIALTDSFSLGIAALSLALMTYIAGFDIIYACQDIDFDNDQQLFSIPERYGIKTALALSAWLHVISFCFFVLIYFMFDMHYIYLGTVIIIGVLYIFEHMLVNPDNLKHINVAFFNVNSIISVMLFTGILADEILRRW